MRLVFFHVSRGETEQKEPHSFNGNMIGREDRCVPLISGGAPWVSACFHDQAYQARGGHPSKLQEWLSIPWLFFTFLCEHSEKYALQTRADKAARESRKLNTSHSSILVDLQLKSAISWFAIVIFLLVMMCYNLKPKRVVRCWIRLPREVMGALSLETLKVMLDRDLNTFWAARVHCRGVGSDDH